MSFDIEGVYRHDTRRNKKVKEAAQYVGITVLSAVVTPVLIANSFRRSFTKIIDEGMKSVGAFTGEKNDGTLSVANQHTTAQLPNQLLGDFVEVSRPINPLVSEVYIN